MAEKKFGLSAAMIIGSIAVGAAAGVFYYYRKNEIKKLAEDIIARVRPVDGDDDEFGDWDIGSVEEPGEADAADVNIVDSGVSLESVETPEEDAGEAAGEEAETVEPEAESEPEAVEPEDEDDDIERPKKPWFWSK